jgi:hypothetical protein
MFKRTILCLIVSGCMVGTASAQPSNTGFVIDPTNTIPGHTAYSVFVNADDGDAVSNPEIWFRSEMVVELTRGSFHNGPPSAPQLPPFQYQIEADPDRAFDTYVGIIDTAGTTSIFGASGLCCQTSPTPPAEQLFDVKWGQALQTTSDYTKIANVTVSNDAIGVWALVSAFKDSVTGIFTQYVSRSGVITSQPILGDLNGDDYVGITDLNLVLINWNTIVTAGDLSVGDPSGDGFVGIDDLNMILGNWNVGYSSPAGGVAVPEPTTLALLGLILPLIGRRRR